MSSSLHQLRWPEKLVIYDLTATCEDTLNYLEEVRGFFRQHCMTSTVTWATKISCLYLLDSFLRNTDESKHKQVCDVIFQVFEMFTKLEEVPQKITWLIRIFLNYHILNYHTIKCISQYLGVTCAGSSFFSVHGRKDYSTITLG